MTTIQWRSRAAAAVAGACLAATAVVAGAGAAHAVPGEVVVTATSAASSVNKSMTATCPAGMRVLGAAGQVVNGNGSVLLTAAVPNAALTAVTVTAEENNAYMGVWQVQAQATCSPAGAVGALTRIQVTSPQNGTSLPTHAAAAACPAGLRVYGLGWTITSAVGGGDMTPVQLQPNAGLTAVASAAVETRAFAPVWNFDSIIVCGAPRAPMALTTAAVGPNSFASNTAVTPACPAGSTITGAGMQVTEIGGLGDIGLARLPVNLATGQVTSAGFEDPLTGTANNWTQLAYGICAS